LFLFSDAIDTYDNTGLNNLKMKCCYVPDPAIICTPVEKRVLLGSCTNAEIYFDKRCDFTNRIGMAYDSSTSKRQIDFYESIGYIEENAWSSLQENFEEKLANNPDTEYDWGDESYPTVWESETKTEAFIYIAPGVKTQLYQIHGLCGIYSIRSNRYYRVDTDLKSGTVTSNYFDIIA